MFKNLFIGVSALAILVGCGDDTKTTHQQAAETKAAEKAGFTYEVGKGNAENAEAALASLALDDNGILKFGSKTLDGANAHFEDISLATADDDDAGLSVAKLSFEGLDKTDETARFGRMNVENLSFTVDDDATNVSLENFEIINPSEELTRLVTDIAEDGKLDGEMPDLLAITFDKLALKNLTVEQTDADESNIVSLAAFSVLGNIEESVSAISLNGLNFSTNNDDTPVSVSVGSAALNGLVKSKVKSFAEMARLDYPSDADMNTLLGDDPFEPGYDMFSVSSVDSSIDGIESMMPSLQVVNTRNSAGKVTSSVMKPVNLVVDATGDSDLATEFKTAITTIGLERLDLTMASAFNMNPDEGTASMNVEDNYIGLKDFMTLRFGVGYTGLNAFADGLQNIDADRLGDDPMAMLELYGPLSFNNIALQLQNNGGVDTLLNLVAQQRGMTVEDLIAEAEGMAAVVPIMASSQGFDAELVNEVISGLISFVKDPKTLSIDLSPSEPLNIKELSNPEALIALTKDRLGLTVTNQ